MAEKKPFAVAFVLSLSRILLFLCAIFLVPFVKGWAFSILWSWFMVTTFNLPPISVIQGTGIFLVFTLLQKQFFAEQQKKTSNKPSILAKEIVDMLIAPLFIVGSGWIFFQFM